MTLGCVTSVSATDAKALATCVTPPVSNCHLNGKRGSISAFQPGHSRVYSLQFAVIGIMSCRVASDSSRLARPLTGSASPANPPTVAPTPVGTTSTLVYPNADREGKRDQDHHYPHHQTRVDR
jgi:hypothetical protein